MSPDPAATEATVRRGLPFATTGVLACLSVAIWVLITSTGGENSPWVDRLALRGAGACTVLDDPASIYPNLTEAHCDAFGRWFPGVSDGAVWQLVTNLFTHAEPWHLALNMLALWLLGPQVERSLGRARYLVVYFVAGLAGSTLAYWLTPDQTLTLGASGAIFGLFGALLMIALRQRGRWRELAIWLAISIAYTFVGTNVSWQGHLGGLLGGVLIAWTLSWHRPRVTWLIGLLIVAGLVIGLIVRTMQLA